MSRNVPLRRWRPRNSKPPMPANMKPHAEAAKARHKNRHTQPGVIVEVENDAAKGLRLASPHRDHDAWESMVCDAFGTRSVASALTFLHSLADLCDKLWHATEDGGERVPDELQLNTILNMVGSIKPRNEMEAALAAQMVAVHLMMMKTSVAALKPGWSTDPRFAATAGKLARTYAILTDTLNKGRKGNRSSKQTIIVRQEKHVHHHQHVHLEGGGGENGHQPHAPEGRTIELRPGCEVSSEDTGGRTLPRPCGEGLEGLPDARLKRRCAKE